MIDQMLLKMIQKETRTPMGVLATGSANMLGTKTECVTEGQTSQ